MIQKKPSVGKVISTQTVYASELFALKSIAELPFSPLGAEPSAKGKCSLILQVKVSNKGAILLIQAIILTAEGMNF